MVRVHVAAVAAIVLVAIVIPARPCLGRETAGDSVGQQRQATDPCASSHTCMSCTKRSNCGWCSVVHACESGAEDGSSRGFCRPSNLVSHQRRWFFNDCPDEGECLGHDRCTECTAHFHCGWCNSTQLCIGRTQAYQCDPQEWRTVSCRRKATGSPVGLLIIAIIIGVVCCITRRRGQARNNDKNTSYHPTPHAQAFQAQFQHDGQGMTQHPAAYQPGIGLPPMQGGGGGPGAMMPPPPPQQQPHPGSTYYTPGITPQGHVLGAYPTSLTPVQYNQPGMNMHVPGPAAMESEWSQHSNTGDDVGQAQTHSSSSSTAML